MTTYVEAIIAADALAEQLQGLIEDGRFLPRFFDRLFGLRTALGSARDRFAADHGTSDGDSPIFATVRDRCDQAIYLGGSVSPTDDAVSGYVAVATCNDDWPDAQSSAFSGAHCVRQIGPASAR